MKNIPRRAIALVDDMFFIAKIRGTAEAVEVIVNFARSINAVVEMATKEPTSLIIADLQAQCCDPFELAAQIKSNEYLKTIPLLGFFSHVQTTLLQQAEQAGYDRILPRSSFSKNLPQILEGSY
jgi:CheY-like chemotaxis protein